MPARGVGRRLLDADIEDLVKEADIDDLAKLLKHGNRERRIEAAATRNHLSAPGSSEVPGQQVLATPLYAEVEDPV